MGKIDIPTGETFVASDGHKYKAVRSDVASTCRGCAFDTNRTDLCYRYSCLGEFRKDHKTVHFVNCE